MRISLAFLVRKIAVQFQLSQELEGLMKTIGGNAWRKMTVDDLYNTIKSAADKVVGHGLSQDAYDKFLAALDAAGSSKEKMVGLATQYLLAGAGMKVLKAAGLIQ